MKIITWNCNLKFKQKFELISSYDPDICFVQECENLNTDFFPGYKFFWTGRNENKGLGILTKGDDFIIDESHNKNLINFLPINFYRDWFGEENERCIVAGDFNNSIIWDKKDNENNFNNINDHFMNLGFASNYHSLKKEIFGKESSATFYHTKNESKKYHIDYIYSKNLNPNKLQVGLYSDWIEYSDHTPLISTY